MARPFHPELLKAWKVTLPASLAARVEIALWDNINKKPQYGSRGTIIEELLTLWLDGKTPTVSVQPNPPEEPHTYDRPIPRSIPQRV